MGKIGKFEINVHILRRIITAIYALLIGTAVAYVMFNFYVPDKNALGAFASVCMDVVCILILIVLIISFVINSYGLRRTTRIFVVLLMFTIWAMFLDFLNWAFDGALQLGHLTFWFTLGSLCMGSILAGTLAMYLSIYLEETYSITSIRKGTKICVILNFISFIITFTLAITGTAFKFVDGHYEIGALYDVVTVIPILTLLYFVVFMFGQVKIVGFHDVFAVVGYILFMIAGALIESAYRIGTTYVGVAIADIFIFILLQNEIIGQEKRNVQMWKEKSNTDVLTGFHNRYAYEADIDMLEKLTPSDNFIYVSADVNSLKMTNDNLGHNAGDELLIGAADCLDKCFGPYGKIYRIGGDEFIALIYAGENDFERIKKEIDEVTGKWKGKLVDGLTISCGYVTKREATDMTVRQMAVLADRRMYEAKEEYYKQTGIERRRK